MRFEVCESCGALVNPEKHQCPSSVALVGTVPEKLAILRARLAEFEAKKVLEREKVRERVRAHRARKREGK